MKDSLLILAIYFSGVLTVLFYRDWLNCNHDWHYDPEYGAALGRHYCIKCHRLGRRPKKIEDK